MPKRREISSAEIWRRRRIVTLQASSKADMAELKAEISALKSDLGSFRADVDQRFVIVDQKLQALEQRLIEKLGAMLVVGVAVLGTILRLT